MTEPFADRAEAGRLLGAALRERLGENADVVVLGLPRGGVAVASEVADVLGAPLDVLVVRKIGVPGQPELAMGALAGGTVVRNADVVHAVGIDDATFAAAADAEHEVATARERSYRGIHVPSPLHDRTAVVVDDGLATGATARAAVQALRHREDDRPGRVVLAVPVAPRDSLADLARLVDDVVCLRTPRPFYAVGEWYRQFGQVSDDEVRALLTWREAGSG
jgi:putative phosphoribosyl transferase